jgi:hypothetical protein
MSTVFDFHGVECLVFRLMTLRAQYGATQKNSGIIFGRCEIRISTRRPTILLLSIILLCPSRQLPKRYLDLAKTALIKIISSSLLTSIVATRFEISESVESKPQNTFS